MTCARALRLIWLSITSLVLLWPALSGADPLPLSRPHAHLDKSSKCTTCHVQFKGVPNTKCLDCHRDIDKRMQRGQGYHGRVARGIPCNGCHREHLGRNHEISPLDKRKFDHNQTGYSLTGGHVGVGCRECHTAKRPGSNRDSFLGAPRECQGCHGEYHGKAVGKVDLKDCQQCHNTFDWNKLNTNVKFNHERETRFPRTGKHKKVDCDKCHLDKKRFGPIEISGCVTCHKNPHPPGVFGRRICEECHVTSGFKQTNIFEHTTTGWPLRGRHKKNECLDCHSWEQWKPRTSDCAGCHKDNHNGQFKGTPCGRCHQESGWSRLKFNHNTMSDFPLKGKHRSVSCQKCHTGGRYKPLASECMDCHKDESPHGDTFKDTPCKNCHSPVSWQKTRFDHSITGFALEGRHYEQPCYRCHPNGTETEVDTVQDCAYCHTDLHSGQFEGAGCDRCHSGFDRWKIPNFDHTVSQFQLTGRHTAVDCGACHKQGHYRPIDTACGNCHKNFHEGQFNKACDTCHTPETWAQVANFDHDQQTEYRLYGKHRTVDCGKCHINNDYKGLPQTCEGCHLDVHSGTKGSDCALCHTTADWGTNSAQNHNFGAFSLKGLHDRLPCEECHGPDRSKVLAGTGPECINCHRDPHFGSLGPQCYNCHTQSAFLPSTFLHNQTGFRLSGAHRFVQCRNCHPNRVFGGLPSDCGFCHLDTYQGTQASPTCNHVGQCSPDNCHECHTTRSFVPARPGVTCGTCESSR